jgi:XTP/dITP diphosphohydrolase
MARPSLSHAHALVVATTNRGKLEELRSLLAALPVEVLSLADVGAERIVVVEDGATFEANAIKKAKAIASATMMLTLADDSGLEVDALGGRPGVRSARFAHDRATDAENNAALIAALSSSDDAPCAGHAARFRCALALVDPFALGGEPQLFEGRCEGAITTTPRGAGGFGYDPLFLVEGEGGRTMAELSVAEKNRVSHRGKAFAELAARLRETLDAREQLTRRVCDG